MRVKFKRTSWNESFRSDRLVDSIIATNAGRLSHSCPRSVCSGQSGSASAASLRERTRKCFVRLQHSKRSAPAKIEDETRTRANSEKAFLAYVFCFPLILLPTEFWRCTGIPPLG